MSAVGAIAGAATGTSHAPTGRVRAMLAAMADRGRPTADPQHPQHSPHTHSTAAFVALGASRHLWEPTVRGAHGERHDDPDGSAVVADASLYYRDDLSRRLGRSPGAASEPAEAILALYRAEGDAGFARLEGDFAFILWDSRQQRLVAGRDFVGRRSMFYAVVGSELLLASSTAGLLADAAVPRDLDLTTIATVAAGYWTHGAHTAYRAIAELPAGHLLVWEPGRPPVVRPFWELPSTLSTRRRPVDDAAQELRELLVRAVAERMPPDASTAVSLSGGWDSSAVYAAGREALRRDATGGRVLRPVSISYPAGDPGREDELISGAVAHWGDSTRWIPVDDIPLVDGSAAGARAQPFAHTYEHWNRALFRAARSTGARVILDGAGGDQLFQVTDIYLSDLFRSGQWLELARQWRTRADPSARHLWRWGIRPALPMSIVRAVAAMRGMSAPGHHFDRREPGWFPPRSLEKFGVLAREAAAAPRLPRTSGVLEEMHAYLRYPFFPRIFALMHALALEEGLESRSPLIDERIVRFAASRPWSDRVDGRETKVVLRRAMRGLLPDSFLAPRAHRTGTTTAYFLRQLRGAARPVIEGALADPLLASLDMIDVARLRNAWAHVLHHDDGETAARIWFTVQTELWLRAHHRGEAAA